LQSWQVLYLQILARLLCKSLILFSFFHLTFTSSTTYKFKKIQTWKEKWYTLKIERKGNVAPFPFKTPFQQQYSKIYLTSKSEPILILSTCLVICQPIYCTLHVYLSFRITSPLFWIPCSKSLQHEKYYKNLNIYSYSKTYAIVL
jgi:hypothetical protein